jgi:hypothetical protein
VDSEGAFELRMRGGDDKDQRSREIETGPSHDEDYTGTPSVSHELHNHAELS